MVRNYEIGQKVSPVNLSHSAVEYSVELQSKTSHVHFHHICNNDIRGFDFAVECGHAYSRRQWLQWTHVWLFYPSEQWCWYWKLQCSKVIINVIIGCWGKEDQETAAFSDRQLQYVGHDRQKRIARMFQWLVGTKPEIIWSINRMVPHALVIVYFRDYDHSMVHDRYPKRGTGPYTKKIWLAVELCRGVTSDSNSGDGDLIDEIECMRATTSE